MSPCNNPFPVNAVVISNFFLYKGIDAPSDSVESCGKKGFVTTFELTVAQVLTILFLTRACISTYPPLTKELSVVLIGVKTFILSVVLFINQPVLDSTTIDTLVSPKAEANPVVNAAGGVLSTVNF